MLSTRTKVGQNRYDNQTIEQIAYDTAVAVGSAPGFIQLSGTAGAPGIPVLTDADSGLFNDSGVVAISSNGVKRLRVDDTELLVNKRIRTEDTTDSTTSSNGALIVPGGAGIVKNLNVDGIVNFNNTLDTSSTVAAFIVQGGAAFKKRLFVTSQIFSNSTNGTTSLGNGGIIMQGGLSCAKEILAGRTIISLDTTEATSSSAASMATAGGLGVAKKLIVDGTISGTNTTDASSSTAAALVTAGGLGVAKKVIIGDTTEATSSSAASFTTAGGVGIAKKLIVDGTITGTDTTEATTSSAAAMVTAGGLGVGKKLIVAGTISGTDTTDASSSTTGAVTTAGGLGVAKKLYVGTGINYGGTLRSTSQSMYAKYGNSTGVSVANATWTPIDASWYHATLFDSQGSDITYSNGVVTFTVPGIFLLNASVEFDANIVGTRYMSFSNATNAASTIFMGLQSTCTTAVHLANLTSTLIFHAIAGDELQVYVYQNSGGGLNATMHFAEPFTVIRLC